MSLQSEFQTLFMSDMSAAAIDQLVTRPGLWLRNTIIHFCVPFLGFHLWHTYPMLRAALRLLLLVFLLLQLVQMFSPHNGWAGIGWLIWDNLFFDPFVAAAGWFLAWATASRGVVK